MSILLGNLLLAVGGILSILIKAFNFLIIARVIISWVNADPFNPLVRIITSSTDPLLNPIKRRMPRMAGPIDFSPLILILVLFFLDQFLVASLLDYGQRIKLGLMG